MGTSVTASFLLIGLATVGITNCLALPFRESLLLALGDDSTTSRTGLTNQPVLPPEIRSLHIDSNIRYRYSRTKVTSKVANVNVAGSQEISFRVVLPETTFISKFVMEIDGKSYEAYVKEKEEARNIYTAAQHRGHSAALVEVNARDSNVFDVNVNIRAQSKVTFDLTYEELLNRKLGRYQQAIHFSPAQITKVKDFQIIVNIEESQNITLLRIPQIRNDVEAPHDAEGNMKGVIIDRLGKTANITWKPTDRDQRALETHGQSGKFIVEYDIARELDAGEVLVMNGYFVHFFAPSGLNPLKKHVIFVLDVSGSMLGTKIKQLKDAMNKILEDLKPDDFFNIITFSSEVNHWTSQSRSPRSLESKLETVAPVEANGDNILAAQKFINNLRADGGTNIHQANIEALQIARGRGLPAGVGPLILFLTDGEPTVGVSNPTEIQTLIKNANKVNSVPIYSLAFGSGADFTFLKQLSLQNNGIARKIYEASDASIQLTGFYNEISSPLLSNVTFNYSSPDFEVTNLTTTIFPTFLGGSEIAVCGTIIPKISPDDPDENQTEALTTPSPDVGLEAPLDNAPPPSGIFDVEFVPTDIVNMVVNVAGTGGSGPVVFKNPAFFKRRYPLWPRPPTHVVPRPTPTPLWPNATHVTIAPPPKQTAEDLFLEKLWAYLTIQQLLNKDLASSGQDESTLKTTDMKETSKKDALKLALKYGFVTPLTSLVVVKPNQTELVETVPTSEDSARLSHAKAQYGGPSPQLLKISSSNLASRVQKAPVPVRKSYSGARSGGGGGYSRRISLDQDYYDNPDPDMYSSSSSARFVATSLSSSLRQERRGKARRPPLRKGWNGRSAFNHYSAPQGVNNNSTISQSVPLSTTVEPPLTLQSLRWFTNDDPTFRFRHNRWTIAVNQTTFDSGYNSGYACESPSSNSTNPGTCQHLRECVQKEFVRSFGLYKINYFCEITSASSSNIRFAGVCCPRKIKK